MDERRVTGFRGTSALCRAAPRTASPGRATRHEEALRSKQVCRLGLATNPPPRAFTSVVVL